MGDCKNMKLHSWLLPILVLGLATGLRLVALGAYPASLYWEEVALGYDAYSLWKTGNDYHGNAWPMVAFESFGDYKPTGYFYLTAPVVGIWGLQNWSVRLPSALLGVLTVWLVYLLGKKVFRHAGIAWAGAFALAVMPWHIHFSRAAFEVNVATAFMVMGIYWLWPVKRKHIHLFLGVMSLIAATYTYHGLRALSPLILMAGAMEALWQRKQRTVWLAGLVLALMLSWPWLSVLHSPVVNQRFNETSLFSTSSAVAITNQLRDEGGNHWWVRGLHHRYWYWGQEIAAGMLSHFSPGFLFFTGDGNPRHQTGDTGLLYFWMGVSLVAAIATMKGKTAWPLWLLVILATIPPALTNLTPHTLRFLPAAPAFALLVGYGSYHLWQKTMEVPWGRFWRFLMVGMVLLELGHYVYDYSQDYVVRSAVHWQYGYQALADYLNQKDLGTAQVNITRAYGRPSMYLLFYSAYEPMQIQLQSQLQPKDQGELLAYDQFRFMDHPEQEPGIVVSHKELERAGLEKIIYLPDGTPVFYIYDTQ
jgi:4-amino-4-deoxy-L-arabinose transferase-like glycosyltransferase